VPRFAKQLRRLQPNLAGDDAMGVALGEATYPEASDLTPEEAAEIYVRQEDVRDVGSRRNTAPGVRRSTHRQVVESAAEAHSLYACPARDPSL